MAHKILFLRQLKISDIKILPKFHIEVLESALDNIDNETILFSISNLFKKEETPVNIIDPDIEQYDKIPTILVNLSTWPKSTNLLCWFCNRKVKGAPWPEPEAVEPSQTKSDGGLEPIIDDSQTIITTGNFCSHSCVIAHINKIHNLSTRQDKLGMLKIIYEIFTQKKYKEVKPSLSPYLSLKCYGGDLTETEYDKYIEELNS